MLQLLLIASTLSGFVTKAKPEHQCDVSIPEVPEAGLPAADVGGRDTFDPDDYDGADVTKFVLAMADAIPVGGAVVMDRFYEWCGYTVYIDGLGGGGLMLTGGGIRRCCSPNSTLTGGVVGTDTCVNVVDASEYVVGRAVGVFPSASYAASYDAFTIASKTATTLCASGALGFTAGAGEVVGYIDSGLLNVNGNEVGIVVDSVAFDSQADCNTQTHGWNTNALFEIRSGVDEGNIVRNNYIYDTPSEAFTACGTLWQNNTAWNLGGSFIHKSCSVDGVLDTLTGNRVYNANIFGDAVMQHSEGVFTFSAEAGDNVASGNVWQLGGEGAWGVASTEDNNVDVDGDCYADFPRLIQLYDDGGGVDRTAWRFNAVLERVGPGLCCSATVGAGSPL